MKSFRDYAPRVVPVVLILVVAGCRKQKTTLETPEPPSVEQPDTSFAEVSGFGDIDTTDEAVFREAELEAELQRKVDENLRPVYFEFNSYRLSGGSIEQLVKAANFLSEYTQLRLLIEGHCDERGSSEYNMGLGENRARAVKEYLINYGIPAIRFETTSWGEERPAKPGCAEESCHAENRRAEFKVLRK
jgi:peptidoglycan-associated lipoprotein